MAKIVRPLVLALSVALMACESQVPVENAITDTATEDKILADAAAAERASDAALDKVGNSAAPAVTSNSWNYTTTKDELTGKEIKSACVTSENQVSLDFPYEDTTARLCVRQHPQWGRDIYVALDDDGQILCTSYEGCEVGVRFGKAAVSRYDATGPEDNSTTHIFVSDGSSGRFLDKLKKADETVVQLPLYQAGSQALIFKTAGLKW